MLKPPGLRCLILTENRETPEVLETLELETGCQGVLQRDNLYSAQDGALWSHADEQGITMAELRELLSPDAAPSKSEAKVSKLVFCQSSDRADVRQFFEDRIQGQSRRFCESVRVIVEELFMNATIDAPRERRLAGNLPLNEQLTACEFSFVQDELRGYIFCSDPYGSLDIAKLISHLRGVYLRGASKAINMRDDSRGAGLGAFLMLESASTMYLAVTPGKQSLVGFALPLQFSNREREEFRRNICILRLRKEEK